MHPSASDNNPDYPTEAPRMTDPVRRDPRARQGNERNRSQIDRFPAEIIMVPAIEKKPQPPSSHPRGCEEERKQSGSLVRLSEGCKETGPSIASATMSQPPDVMSPDCEGEFCLFNRSSHTINGSAGNNKQFTLPELESPGDPQFGKLSEESIFSKDCSVALALLEDTRERSTPLMRERVQPTTCTQEFPLPESGHGRVERTVENESASKPTLVQKISIKNPMAAELKIKLEVEPVTPPTSPSSEDSIPLVNKVDDRPIEEYEKGSSNGSLESPELRCFDSTGNGPEVPPEVSNFVEEYEDYLIWGDLEDGTQGPQPASQLSQEHKENPEATKPTREVPARLQQIRNSKMANNSAVLQLGARRFGPAFYPIIDPCHGIPTPSNDEEEWELVLSLHGRATDNKFPSQIYHLQATIYAPDDWHNWRCVPCSR
ncbi:hypothetical protein QAD02_004041 [Eretmocerus hayati]|uniref:Uncharacterized protein n=1 Tax=Eretmocerus hayati TaxID=131215 RepID=A0ACC2NPF9_9HYME|nr:hypothetical protein QAD02_004041 [Eretmocerus hayati]